MKLLLDENLPHDLRHFVVGHECITVAYLGWQGTENGELLRRAEAAGFDAVLTLDVGMQFQQNPALLPVAVILLHAPSNKLDDLRPLVPELLRVLQTLTPRSLITVG